MKPQELKDWILSLVQDIEFNYKDKHGVISPWSVHSFTVGYAGESKDYTNIDELMNDKFFDGLSLNQIAEDLQFVN